MKNVLSIVMFLWFSIGFSQTKETKEDIEKYQTEWTQGAEERVRNNELAKAFVSYGLIKQMDSTTKLGKSASRKVDSLKRILRKDLKSNLIGTWRQKYSGSVGGIIRETSKESTADHILIISKNSLAFYTTDKSTEKTQHIKTEVFKFNTIAGGLPSFHELVFADQQIWSFRIQDNGLSLHLVHTGEIIENNSRTEIVSGNAQIIYERIK